MSNFKDEVRILLPDKIYIRKMKEHQGIVTMTEEYNIYFKNIIFPFDEKWDIQIRCDYGNNLGNCWRLTNFSEAVEEFDFELIIYNEYGEKIASKSAKVIPAARKENTVTKVMFIGDSMTHSQVYVNHIINNSYGIETVGIRCFDGINKIEGRGGWSYKSYFNNWGENFDMSPFLFPEDVNGEDYYGYKTFVDRARKSDSEVYQFYGYNYDEIRDGQYYTIDKKLYKKSGDNDVLVSEEPEYEFSFSKYLKRYKLDKPEIVSILLGANDLHICPYEQSDLKIAEYIDYAERFVKAIRSCDKNIKVIINMPVLGGNQYSWGMQTGCSGSEKMYRFNIMKASYEILKHFNSQEENNVYISPMIACIDPENGFPHSYVKANKYSEKMIEVQSDRIHPNNAGYFQMGDCLSGVIEYIRCNKE